MPQTLNVINFLETKGVVLDVRSPAEYERGHIPGAMSFPLFSNAERAEVGTCYKQQGREQAVELGLRLVGPKLAGFVTTAKDLAPDKQVRVHCWRGGMRSSSMAWLLETAGMQVTLLEGGYKAFRRWVLDAFEISKSILILGGMTGTGKTETLLALAELGEQVLDLEQLANHRGSSYGNFNLPPQPSDEHFQNLIAVQWVKFHPHQRVWVEAESKRIGVCRVPESLFKQMEKSPVIQLFRPRSQRIDLLLKEYGSIDPKELAIATQRLRKRLGNERTQAAIHYIYQGQLAPAIDLVLDYYDHTYTYDLQRRSVTIYTLDATHISPRDCAPRLQEQAQKVKNNTLELEKLST